MSNVLKVTSYDPDVGSVNFTFRHDQLAGFVRVGNSIHIYLKYKSNPVTINNIADPKAAANLETLLNEALTSDN